MEAVLTGGPWVFDGNLLLLKPWVARGNIEQATVEEIMVWLQIKNLPIFLRFEDDIRKATRRVGEVVEVDKKVANSEGGDYVGARVKIKLGNPFLRGCYFKVLEDKVWLDYRFERLPNGFEWCGCISHFSEGCKKVTEAMKENEEPGYGPWMLHRPPPRKKKNMSEYPMNTPAKTGSAPDAACEENADTKGLIPTRKLMGAM